MAIIPSIIKWLNNNRMEQIDLFREHPFETQEQELFNLLDKASGTEWGRMYDFRSIGNADTFRKRLPLQKYEDIAPQIERLRGGETNIMWPGTIRWFAKSSGTTNSKSKFIPVSDESLEDCHYKGARDTLVFYASRFSDSGIFRGKGLTLGGSHRVTSFNNDALYGDLSAILIENAPFYVNLIKTPRSDIALLEDFNEKLQKITTVAINENVTSLTGVPSWYLVLLRHILDHTGKENILEVWPNLEVFFHGGINFEPYRDIYRQLIPSESMRYMESYNASEGFFALQDDLSSSDMLLMLDYGVYYEFIPLSELNKSDNPPSLLINEVEQGVSYAIVITTNGGLWRYLIGDTVTFTSLYPHKIKLTGRTKLFINAFGEEVVIDNAERAITNACRKTGAAVSEYTAGPVYMNASEKGSHEWIVEFESEPDDIEMFRRILDETLQSVNSDYEAKRMNNNTLLPPVVRVVPQGTFLKWFEKKNKLGGQNKMPRLSNDRTYIEDFYSIAGLAAEAPGQ